LAEDAAPTSQPKERRMLTIDSYAHVTGKIATEAINLYADAETEGELNDLNKRYEWQFSGIKVCSEMLDEVTTQNDDERETAFNIYMMARFCIGAAAKIASHRIRSGCG